MDTFLALLHNGSLIRKAEKIISDMAENENCYMYLVNPDGTRIRIQSGCKIEDYEFTMFQKPFCEEN